jgi:DNA-binding FrmR family transcriptional regulator
MLCRICLREPKSTSRTNASPLVFQRLFGQGRSHLTPLRPEYRIPTYTNVGSAEAKPDMSHVIRDKQKLLNRVRRIRGQVEAIERALDGEAGCAQIMHQIAGCRGAINSLLVEVVEDHIRTHLVDPAKKPEALDAEAGAQLIEVVHSYFR